MTNLKTIILLLYFISSFACPSFAQEEEQEKIAEAAEEQAPQEKDKLKDPFLSLDDKIKLGKDPIDITKFPYPINVKGIIWTKDIQIAFINEDTVEKNQNWMDFLVEDIQKDKVILKLGKRRFEIPLQLEKEK